MIYELRNDLRDEKTYLKCDIVLRNKMYSTYTTIRINFEMICLYFDWYETLNVILHIEFIYI